MMSQSELAQLTLELCSIPSVTGQEEACTRYLERKLIEAGCRIEQCGQTIAARLQGEQPVIVLAGHSDTVPLKASDGSILNGEFTKKPRIENNRLYGLGASDMKAGLAIMLKLSREKLRVPVGLVFYDREEGPWAESGLGPALEKFDWLKKAQLVFCLEPSDNVVQVGCVGSLQATVRFIGKAAHSARPWQGLNAIHAAAPLLSALAARAPVEARIGGHLFREVISATLASGGVGRNIIPESFELNLNYRFFPGKTVEEAEAELIQFIRSSAPAAQIHVTDKAPSGKVITENPLFQEFLTLTQVEVTAKQAWTDVARFSQLGIPAVNLGPGASAQAHQAGEWVELSRIEEGYQLFHRFLCA
jgi:succinyl-diaminopimelate desuccinylase